MSCGRLSKLIRPSLAIVLGGLVAVTDATVRADVFKLSGGGQVQGVWVNRDQVPVTQYEIRLHGGGRLVLDAPAVKAVVHESQKEQAYQDVLAKSAKDASGHWAVAQWCGEHGLNEKRRYHLQRVLRLDPDHVPARRALGYTYVRGQWVTQDEFMSAQGYVRYRGRWELPQRVVLLEARRNRQAAARQWYRQLSLWRRDVGTDAGHGSVEKIAGVDDPMAVPALVRLLMEEKLRPVRLLYVQTLAKIGTQEAEQCLLSFSLTDYDTEVVHAICDQLQESHRPSVHEELLKALRNENNYLVNRAAIVLGRLGTEDDLVSLIDALVTQHLFIQWDPVAEEWVVKQREVCNRQVLDTLVALSETASYGYDKQAWKQWHYLRVKQVHAIEAGVTGLRRDRK